MLPLLDRCSSTTLLVSPGTEGFDLLGVKEPEDEILEEPEQHLNDFPPSSPDLFLPIVSPPSMSSKTSLKAEAG